MSLRVFMPPPGEDWIGDVTTNEFRTATRHTVVDSIQDADVIWLYSKWIAGHFPQQLLRSKPCITTVHHIAVQKGIDIGFFDGFTDIYHVPNAITAKQLLIQTQKSIKILPYWVPTAFKRLGTPSEGRLGSQFIFGSFQRDTEGASIRSGQPMPKLEKGPDILVDVVSRFLSDDCALVLAGWRRQYVKSRLPADNILDYTGPGVETKAFGTHEGVNQLYNRLRDLGGVYLVTSRCEGGPQAVLEAAATGCPILSTSVGVAPDVLHPHCLCGDADDPGVVDRFEQKIRDGLPWDEIVGFNAERARALAIENVIGLYDGLIQETYERNK